MKKIKEFELRNACYQTVEEIYYKIHKIYNSLNFDNYQLHTTIKNVRNKLIEFLRILFSGNDLYLKENIFFCILFFVPEFYGSVWGGENYDVRQ